MRRSTYLPLLASGFATIAAPLSCIDANHDAQVQALGGEAAGVPPGPFHRPGQPCVLCHGEAGPASQIFSVAGTVYATQGQKTPAVGATVIIEDVNGKKWTFATNAVGNFYATPSQYSPTFPIGMIQVTGAGNMVGQFMLSRMGRDGSCAACHANPASTTSPGPVYAATAATVMAPPNADGGP